KSESQLLADLQALANESVSDSLPLAFREHGNRGQTDTGARIELAIDLYRAESGHTDDLATGFGHHANPQIAGGPEQFDQTRFIRRWEGCLEDPPDRGGVGGLFGPD